MYDDVMKELKDNSNTVAYSSVERKPRGTGQTLFFLPVKKLCINGGTIITVSKTDRIWPRKLSALLCRCSVRIVKFGNFRDIFAFANSVKSHIYDAKNTRLRH